MVISGIAQSRAGFDVRLVEGQRVVEQWAAQLRREAHLVYISVLMERQWPLRRRCNYQQCQNNYGRTHASQCAILHA